jgi:hypothetical protein
MIRWTLFYSTRAEPPGKSARAVPPSGMKIVDERRIADHVGDGRQRVAFSLAGPRSARQHGLEHGLQLAGRTRDDAQHFRGRWLLRPRFVELTPA